MIGRGDGRPGHRRSLSDTWTCVYQQFHGDQAGVKQEFQAPGSPTLALDPCSGQLQLGPAEASQGLVSWDPDHPQLYPRRRRSARPQVARHPLCINLLAALQEEPSPAPAPSAGGQRAPALLTGKRSQRSSSQQRSTTAAGSCDPGSNGRHMFTPGLPVVQESLAEESDTDDDGLEDQELHHHHPGTRGSRGGQGPCKKMAGANGRSSEELMLLDPKRVKRILANRQSAARSKERRQAYTLELEGKLNKLAMEQNSVDGATAALEQETTQIKKAQQQLAQQLKQLKQQLQELTAGNKALSQQLQAATAGGTLPVPPPAAAGAGAGAAGPLPKAQGPGGRPRGHHRHHSWGGPHSGASSSTSSRGGAHQAAPALPAPGFVVHGRSHSHGAASPAMDWLQVPPATLLAGGEAAAAAAGLRHPGHGRGGMVPQAWGAGQPATTTTVAPVVKKQEVASPDMGLELEWQQQQLHQQLPHHQQHQQQQQQEEEHAVISSALSSLAAGPADVAMADLVLDPALLACDLGASAVDDLLLLSPSSAMEWVPELPTDAPMPLLADSRLMGPPAAAAAGIEQQAKAAGVPPSGNSLMQPAGGLHTAPLTGSSTAAGWRAAGPPPPVLLGGWAAGGSAGGMQCGPGFGAQGSPSVAPPGCPGGGSGPAGPAEGAAVLSPRLPPGSMLPGGQAADRWVPPRPQQQQQQQPAGLPPPPQLQHAHSWPNSMWQQQQQPGTPGAALRSSSSPSSAVMSPTAGQAAAGAGWGGSSPRVAVQGSPASSGGPPPMPSLKRSMSCTAAALSSPAAAAARGPGAWGAMPPPPLHLHSPNSTFRTSNSGGPGLPPAAFASGSPGSPWTGPGGRRGSGGQPPAGPHFNVAAGGAGGSCHLSTSPAVGELQRPHIHQQLLQLGDPGAGRGPVHPHIDGQMLQRQPPAAATGEATGSTCGMGHQRAWPHPGAAMGGMAPEGPGYHLLQQAGSNSSWLEGGRPAPVAVPCHSPGGSCGSPACLTASGSGGSSGALTHGPGSVPAHGMLNSRPAGYAARHQRTASADVAFTLGANPSASWSRAGAAAHRRSASGSGLPSSVAAPCGTPAAGSGAAPYVGGGSSMGYAPAGSSCSPGAGSTAAWGHPGLQQQQQQAMHVDGSSAAAAGPSPPGPLFPAAGAPALWGQPCPSAASAAVGGMVCSPILPGFPQQLAAPHGQLALPPQQQQQQQQHHHHNHHPALASPRQQVNMGPPQLPPGVVAGRGGRA